MRAGLRWLACGVHRSSPHQWDNIRYTDGWINRSKGTDLFPDPFVVQDNWFELELPSLELNATQHVPTQHQIAVANLLKRVKDDARVMRQRQRYFNQYRDGLRSIELLDADAPLLGRAFRRNLAFLLPVDFARYQAGTL